MRYTQNCHKLSKKNKCARNSAMKRTLCQAMLTNNATNLWSEIKKINSVKSVPVSEVDGFNDNESIASCFARRYKSLFSSVENSKI